MLSLEEHSKQRNNIFYGRTLYVCEHCSLWRNTVVGKALTSLDEHGREILSLEEHGSRKSIDVFR
jgi:hypothetical protein